MRLDTPALPSEMHDLVSSRECSVHVLRKEANTAVDTRTADVNLRSTSVFAGIIPAAKQSG
jgi:hypothetical protein